MHELKKDHIQQLLVEQITMKLEIFDTEGTKIELGDLVQIQEKRNGNLTFFSRVTIIGDKLWPFDGFAYDRIFKIKTIPVEAKHCPAIDNHPEYWMHPDMELKLIEEGTREDWILDHIDLSKHPFYKISAE